MSMHILVLCDDRWHPAATPRGGLTPGHNLEVWLHPAYQALLHNALQWCAKAL